MNSKRLTGSIVRLPLGKPFGFIADPESRGQDYFFHQQDLETGRFEDLIVGDLVSFDAVEGPKGLRAAHITHVSQTPLTTRERRQERRPD